MPHIPDEARVLVLYGDTPLVPARLLAQRWRDAADSELALLTTAPADPTGYGRIVRDCRRCRHRHRRAA